MLKKLNIHHITTAVFNPTANGACERLVQSVKRMLSRMVGGHETSYPKILPHVRAAYMRRIHRATGFSPMHMLTGIPSEPLVPLGDLLPSVSSVSVIAADLPPHYSYIVDPTFHQRCDIDVITPHDFAWMERQSSIFTISDDIHQRHPPYAYVRTVDVTTALDELDHSLQLDHLADTILAAKQYVDATTTERERIYSIARRRLTQNQRINRERYLKMLQSRPGKLTFDVKPNDLVLVHNKDSKGLRSPLLGPFQVIRVTSKGNVIVTSRPSTPDATSSPQWSVTSDRVYPYRYANQCYDTDT